MKVVDVQDREREIRLCRPDTQAREKAGSSDPREKSPSHHVKQSPGARAQARATRWPRPAPCRTGGAP